MCIYNYTIFYSIYKVINIYYDDSIYFLYVMTLCPTEVVLNDLTHAQLPCSVKHGRLEKNDQNWRFIEAGNIIELILWFYSKPRLMTRYSHIHIDWSVKTQRV